MKNFKRILLSILLVPIILWSVCVFSACTYKPESEPDIQVDGVNVVLTIEEADTLLAQAKIAPAGEGLQTAEIMATKSNKDKHSYTKADLLLIINQIKENILNSDKIGMSTNYTIEQTECTETGVVTKTESYFYAKQGIEESETWYKTESGELYSYDIYDEGNGKTYIKRHADPFMNNNGVYDFCQGKFTFTCKTLVEDDIEKFVINKNKIYIKLKTTIFVDGDLEVSENFEVRDGRIVKDHLKWEGIDLVIKYTYDNDVDLTPLTLPEGIDWKNE